MWSDVVIRVLIQITIRLRSHVSERIADKYGRLWYESFEYMAQYFKFVTCLQQKWAAV